ncbi:MAG: carbon starvation protein A [Mycobacteriaceae bacterium]|nr:carbon starvation protein A [Mycobacteriaceae bacterium]
MSMSSTIEYLRTDPALPPVGVVDRSPMSAAKKALFAVIALVGAVAWVVIALFRGEQINAVWFVLAAISSYLLAYRFYARFIEWKIAKPRDDRATPAEELENGRDFLPMDRRVLYGHHFAAIAGAGPLVGPVLAMQMGYLPGTLWIIVGVVAAGAVQDYLVLWASSRRRGRSLGQMAREELGAVGGVAAIVGVFVIMLILLAVLGLVVVQALAHSPWGVFSIAMTIPIALFMGVYLRVLRPGQVGEASLIGFALLLLAIAGGKWVADTSWGQDWFTLSATALSWCLIGYGFVAAVLPVWLLLAPRDYLSTFMKIGTIGLLALGILVTAPAVHAPAVSQFAHNSSGPAFAGSLFPFLFITIACGALSGFHALVASGTTPKLLQKESHTRMIGYGGMLMESFVAVMALIAAAVLDQHLYFGMNSAANAVGLLPTDNGAAAAAKGADYVNKLGLDGAPITADQLLQHAKDVGEPVANAKDYGLVSRSGGAPTLAVGMSQVLQSFVGGSGLKAFWYHFAIMFEALFILTTIDAGTRVARFMLSDSLGNLGGPARRFRDPSWRVGAWICTTVVVAGWGSVLLMGVNDPFGGINALFPLFGIANQLLAAIALTVVTVIVVKKGLSKWAWIPGVPLVWDLVVTMSASWQKIFSQDPKIGYWRQHGLCKAAQENLEAGGAGKGCLTAKGASQIDAAIRNTFIDGTLSIVFAVLVLIVVAAGAVAILRTWRSGPRPTTETPPVESRIFAPSGLIPTAVEREVQKQWDERTAAPNAAGTEA